jgi:beta-galactosidase
VRDIVSISILFLYGFLAFTPVNAGNPMQRTIPFDDNWFFHLADSIPDAKRSVLWKKVAVPHDWSSELPFSKKAAGGIATGHKAGGTGWYLKKFKLTKSAWNKMTSLYFEGIYMETEIRLNGKKVDYHPNGYTSFRCDITPYCKPVGMENELKIKVINGGKNSRWYSGSGIYRHVWLTTTEKIYLDTWHTSVTTESASKDNAIVSISTDLFNATNRKIQGELLFEIRDQSGRKVQSGNLPFISVDNKAVTIRQKITINKPLLWNTESPALYTAKIFAQVKGKTVDSIAVPFGIRTITFSATNGFLLNGQPLKLKGGCIHHDNGLLGSAAIDRAEIRKVELLKANGFNAVRCAHNPPSEQFLNACDSLGLLVINEAFDQWQKAKNPDDYHRFFTKWGTTDIESMVRRDRNHPSIIMWSIGNEIQERADSVGMQMAVKLKNAVRALDATRPVTAAVNEFWDNPQLEWADSERAFRNLDVCGYNYMWREYENDHRLYPDRIIYGSESTAMERAVNWDLVEAHPYIIGDFIWTAIDYLGESGIGNTGYYAKEETKFPQFMDYPWFNGWCGDIDICGNAKPQSLYRKVVWRNSNIEMLVHTPVPDNKKEKVSYWGWPDELPSWNWQGCENKLLDVKVFTRYPIVRLYLNNRLLEEKTIVNDKNNLYTAAFQVAYQRGALKAVGWENGTAQDSVLLTTTGQTAGIRLTADRNTIRASQNDLAYVSIELVDSNGHVVPDEDMQLSVSLKGEGEVISGNADPTDTTSFRSLTPRTFRGKALAIVRPTGKTGTMMLEIKNEKVGTKSITLSAY